MDYGWKFVFFKHLFATFLSSPFRSSANFCNNETKICSLREYFTDIHLMKEQKMVVTVFIVSPNRRAAQKERRKAQKEKN